jgi:hypothetical protein
LRPLLNLQHDLICQPGRLRILAPSMHLLSSIE